MMVINRIKAKNFKSFKEFEMKLNRFNVLIGNNGSGKSNLISLFKFLGDITRHGIKNAISLQGGMQFLKNMHLSDENLEINIEFTPFGWHESDQFGFPKCEYDLTISSDGKEFKVEMEKLKFHILLYKKGVSLDDIFVTNEKEGKIDYNKNSEIYLGKIDIFIEKKGIETTFRIEPLEGFKGDIKELEERIGNKLVKSSEIDYGSYEKDNLLLNHVPLHVIPHIGEIFEDFIVYELNPRSAKNIIPVAGKFDLEVDGSNLAIVLNNLLDDEEDKIQLSLILKELIPSISEILVEEYLNKFLLIELKESFIDDEKTKWYNTPASFLSDGTLNILMILIVLYFQKKYFTIIEEPTKNIHPSLVSKLVELFKEISIKNQIIITSHNPIIVKNCGLENIFLIKRDNEGFSNIIKPENNKIVKSFLANEMELDELFIDNLLGTEIE